MKVDFEKLEKKEDLRVRLMERFKRLKEQEGWTQVQLAEAMHLSRQTIAAWFNDNKMPRKKACVLIEEILQKYKE